MSKSTTVTGFIGEICDTFSKYKDKLTLVEIVGAMHECIFMAQSTAHGTLRRDNCAGPSVGGEVVPDGASE